MKKLITSSFISLLLFNFVSCKKKETEIKPMSKDTTQIKIEEIKTSESISYSSNFILQLSNNEIEFIKKIKNQKPEEVNHLFDLFRKKTEAKLQELNASEEKLLDDYNSFYDEKTTQIIIPKNLKSKFDDFAKAGLVVRGIGEGYNEIQLKPSYYSQLVQNNATPDYVAYLKLEAKDNAVLYSADAGLVISFQELSERVLYWENFLVQYPKSKLYNKAKESYGYYLTDYLFGMDNTPTFDDEKSSFYPENIAEFKRFTQANPSSASTKLITIMLDNFEKTKDIDKVRNNMRAEIQKYFIKSK
jgi:hypothetical protein